MTEQWLSVVGWEGLFWVSDHGRVRSADRVTNGRRIKGRVLKPSPHLLVIFWSTLRTASDGIARFVSTACYSRPSSDHAPTEWKSSTGMTIPPTIT